MNKNKQLIDALEYAWSIISNAYFGNWENAPDEWKYAAEKFRDNYHDILSKINEMNSEEHQKVDKANE